MKYLRIADVPSEILSQYTSLLSRYEQNRARHFMLCDPANNTQECFITRQMGSCNSPARLYELSQRNTLPYPSQVGS
jgi:hypothetical protein